MPDKKSHSDQLPLELPAIFSYSQLNTFKSCPQQFKIVYLDGIRKGYDSIEAFMGKRVHGVLEWLYNEDNRKKPYLTFDRLCKAYDEIWIDNWHNNIFIADPRRTTDYYFTIGKRCLSNYYGRYGPTFDEPVEEVEYELEFSIGNNAFRGIVDRLDQPEPGKWVIHDYKTGKHAKSERQALNDLQLALYQIAVEQNFGEVKEITLTWHFLRKGIEVSVSHTPEQMEKLQKKLLQLVEKITVAKNNSSDLLPKESILCNWCYLWEECTAKVGPNPVKRAY